MAGISRLLSVHVSLSAKQLRSPNFVILWLWGTLFWNGFWFQKVVGGSHTAFKCRRVPYNVQSWTQTIDIHQSPDGSTICGYKPAVVVGVDDAVSPTARLVLRNYYRRFIAWGGRGRDIIVCAVVNETVTCRSACLRRSRVRTWIKRCRLRYWPPTWSLAGAHLSVGDVTVCLLVEDGRERAHVTWRRIGSRRRRLIASLAAFRSRARRDAARWPLLPAFYPSIAFTSCWMHRVFARKCFGDWLISVATSALRHVWRRQRVGGIE